LTYFWKPIRGTWQDKLIILDSAITGNSYEKAAQFFIGYNRQIRDYEPGDSTYVLSDEKMILLWNPVRGYSLAWSEESLDKLKVWSGLKKEREQAEQAMREAIKKAKVV